jgi:hypothetical protein
MATTALITSASTGIGYELSMGRGSGAQRCLSFMKGTPSREAWRTVCKITRTRRCGV